MCRVNARLGARYWCWLPLLVCPFLPWIILLVFWNPGIHVSDVCSPLQKKMGDCWQWTEVSQRVLVLHASDHFSLFSFSFQDSKEYGHTFRRDLKEEILMLMARDRHPPEVGLCWHSGFAVVIRCILTSVSSNTDGRWGSFPWFYLSLWRILPSKVTLIPLVQSKQHENGSSRSWQLIAACLLVNFSLKRKPIVGFEICGWSHYYPRAECFAFFFS